jgi:hypothetical protein
LTTCDDPGSDHAEELRHCSDSDVNGDVLRERPSEHEIGRLDAECERRILVGDDVSQKRDRV